MTTGTTIGTTEPLRLRHEVKHQISPPEDLVLSGRLRRLFPHDKHAGADGSYRVTSLYFDTPYDTALREKLDSSKPDIVKGLDDSQWESYLKNPSVTVHWSTDFQSVLEQNAAEKLPDSIKTSKNAVVLNARYLLEAESVK